jgi:hypothetical protein
MIDTQTQEIIYNTTNAFWKGHVSNEAFREMTQGKEIGHRIADDVDDRTTAKLLSEPALTAKFEYNNKGRKILRSMGDIWIKSNGIYNPINIKAGIVTEGCPNIVSLTKLLTRLLKHQIDSYYLMIVKFKGSREQYQSHVYFVDLLDYLDFANFDLGPGQVMLQESRFYEYANSGEKPPTLSLHDKVDKCVAIMHDAYERLLRNRKTRIDNLEKQISRFKETNDFTVNQEGLFFDG